MDAQLLPPFCKCWRLFWEMDWMLWYLKSGHSPVDLGFAEVTAQPYGAFESWSPQLAVNQPRGRCFLFLLGVL